MNRFWAAAIYLCLSACSGGHPAYAADPSDPEVCLSVDGARDVAKEHGNKFEELTQLQFDALRVGLNKLGYPIPEEIVKAYATPAIDDGTSAILLGVDKDGCIWGHIVRSMDWFLSIVNGSAS